MAKTEATRCQKCGKRTKQTSQWWHCTSCWKELDKEVDIPSASFIAELSQEERCLLLLHVAGRDVREFFDSRHVPVVSGPEVDVMEPAGYVVSPHYPLKKMKSWAPGRVGSPASA